MNLREATAELHSKAEKMAFNQRMFKGELTKEEYIVYLSQQLGIFDSIEGYDLPHPSLNRVNNIVSDIKELTGETGDTLAIDLLDSTGEYFDYLRSLTQEQLLPHVYLNYLALTYGGQMMKSKVPGSGRMYDFENVQECIGSIRAIQNDDMAEEVNKGFQYIINILDELQRNAG